MTAEIDEFLHETEHLVLGFTHADDDVRTELLGTENIPGILEYFPVFGPLVGRLDALASRSIEHFRRCGIESNRKDVGAEIPGALNVLARHRCRVGQDRNRDRCRIDAPRPLFEDRERIRLRARVRDHRDAHAVKRAAAWIFSDDVDDSRHRDRRPVDANEVPVGVIAIGFPVTGQATVGAICTTTFGVGQ